MRAASPRRSGRWVTFFALILIGAAAPATAQSDGKAEINIINNRDEAVVMRFEYAFRDYTWKLMEHTVAAQDEILYRFPSNIPGCERLRDWRITDGILTISNTKGTICQKRISLCDKVSTTMDVRQDVCNWTVDK
jgi:hypothetical protein